MFYNNQNLWRENFDVLLHIDLIDVCSFFQKAEDIDFFKFCAKRNLSQCEYDEEVICKTLIEINQKGRLLWMLDGYDELELSSQKRNISSVSNVSNELIKIITDTSQNRLLKNVLITSRPGVKEFPINSFFLEMGGFGENEKKQYIENYLVDSLEKREIAIDLLEKNNNLNSSMNIALYLEMICVMVNNQKSFILNYNVKLGEMYQNIIDYILKINIRKERFLKIDEVYLNDIDKVLNLMKKLISLIAFYCYERKLFFIEQITITSICRCFLESPEKFDITQFDVESSLKKSEYSFKESIFPVDGAIEIISQSGIFRKVGEHLHFIHFTFKNFYFLFCFPKNDRKHNFFFSCIVHK